MSFQLEELLRGAGTLDELVQQLVGIENEARQVQDCLAPFLYDSYRTGCDALNAVAESAKEVGKVRQELVKVAADVRASHRDYVEAEARNVIPRFPTLDEMEPAWPPTRDMSNYLASALLPYWTTPGDIVHDVLEVASTFGHEAEARKHRKDGRIGRGHGTVHGGKPSSSRETPRPERRRD